MKQLKSMTSLKSVKSVSVKSIAAVASHKEVSTAEAAAKENMRQVRVPGPDGTGLVSLSH